MNPYFVPVIGSGFDEIARQQALWAGMNNNVDRANLDSVARASELQNAWNLRQQEIANDQANRQADMAQRNYQFGANAAATRDANQQNAQLERERIAGSLAGQKIQFGRQDEDRKRNLGLMSDQDNYNAASALAEIGGLSDDEINSLNATPFQKKALKSANDAAKQSGATQYQFASSLADEMNKRDALTALAAKMEADKTAPTGNESWFSRISPISHPSNLIPGYLPGSMSVGSPDTSWFAPMVKRIKDSAQSITDRLKPYETDKGGIEQFGIIQDPSTGKYRPITQPQQTQAQPAPAKPAIKPGTAYKGYIYIGGDPKSPDSWKPQSQ